MKHLLLKSLALLGAVWAWDAAASSRYVNPLEKAVHQGLLSAKDSSETPALFDEKGRRLRWRNILQFARPNCPNYESWRTHPMPTDKETHALSLAFGKPYEIGTLIAFGGDGGGTFTVSSEPGAILPSDDPRPRSVQTAVFTQPVTNVVFTAATLSKSVKLNWGSYANLDNGIISYQFGLLGLYSYPEPRVNIASQAKVRVPGVRINKVAEKEYIAADGLNDETTRRYWCSEAVKDTNTPVDVALSFLQPVTAREVALYFGHTTMGGMPARVEILADDAPFGVMDGFDNHAFMGAHFYLVKNVQPERKVTTLTLRCFANGANKSVAISEILVLAKPGENARVAKVDASFAKTFTVKAPGAAEAGARIERRDGTLVRNLVAQKGAGVFTFAWDGADENGTVVEPGDYVVRGQTHAAYRAEYESSPYASVPVPWVTPDRRGGWLSDHFAPTTIEACGDSIWVGSPLAEAGDTIMELDRAGNKKWGVRWLNLAGANVIRVVDGNLFVACSGGWIGTKIVVTKMDPVTKKFTKTLDFTFPKECGVTQGHGNKVAIGFAATAAEQAVAVTMLDKIYFFDAQGKATRAITVPAPGSMRYLAADELAVASGARVVVVDPRTGAETRVLAGTNLKRPGDFTRAADGGWWVCDAGANQVKKFSASGAYERAVGTGRAHVPGPFDAKAMNAPSAALELPNGELWVTELSKLPKRISVWKAATGDFIRHYLGPARYAGGAWLDYGKGTDTFFAEGAVFKKRNGVWDIASIYWNPSNALAQVFDVKGLEERTPERPIYWDGKTFLAQDSYWAPHLYSIHELLPNGASRPYAALGLVKKKDPANKKERPPLTLWVDRNRNGVAEPEEISTATNRFVSLSWGARIGEDGSFHFAMDDGKVCRLAPTMKNGYPDYDLANIRVIARVRGFLISIDPLPGNRVLVNVGPRLLCLDIATGKTLWSYANPHPSNSHDSPLPKPGDLQHPLDVEGAVHVPGFGDVFMVNVNKGYRMLFRTDGLYCGQLFGDQRLVMPLAVNDVKPGMDLAGCSLMDEAFCGAFARCADGKVRFAGGKCHHTIYEVKGLETLREFTQTLTFSMDDMKAAARAKAVRQLEARASLVRPAIRIGTGDVRREKPGAVLVEDRRQLFSARFTLDATNFNGIFDVGDDSPFVNTGDDPKMLFKSGDSVNIELGNHNTKGVQPNDVRILIAPFKGKPTVVLYRYRVPGVTEGQVEFTSPVRKIVVDRVEILEDARVWVHRNAPHNTRYTLQFAIPRRHLPALDGKELFGDVGVIFSDQSGSKNAYNAFYNSALKGVTADLPSEIMLLPRQWKALAR